MPTAPFTDIPSAAWKTRLPAAVVAAIELARLDRPIGIWLLLFPCLWGLSLAGAPARLYVLFAIGAVAMRGAGCTINDIIDRRVDAEVERTRGRPLPSGRIGLRGALIFLALQLAVGLVVLLQLNRAAILTGVASLPLVVTYPLMKRVTWWPQFFLGLAFNWGIPLGWVAAGGRSFLPPFLLYAGGVAWTLSYDTIYAHQDRIDDARIGVRSTARRFAALEKWPILVFYVLFFALAAAGLSLAGMMNWQAVAVLGVTVLASLALVAWWRPDSPASCLVVFRANRWIGLAVFAAIVAGHGCLG